MKIGGIEFRISSIVPKGEVWVAQPVSRSLEESVSETGDYQMAIRTHYKVVAKVVNVQT